MLYFKIIKNIELNKNFNNDVNLLESSTSLCECALFFKYIIMNKNIISNFLWTKPKAIK